MHASVGAYVCVCCVCMYICMYVIICEGMHVYVYIGMCMYVCLIVCVYVICVHV